MLPAPLKRLLAAAPTAAARAQVFPPDAPRTTHRIAQELRAWLPTGWPQPLPRAARERHGALERAREDFVAAIDDLEGPRAARLAHAVQRALTLRDLWYLRAEVYSLVAGTFGQPEAEARLAPLNRHFPTRSPKSGFGALDPLAR